MNFERPNPEAAQENPLKRALENLNLGISITELPARENLGNKRMLRLDITDRETWTSEEAARKLVPYLGELAWQAYRTDETKQFESANPERAEEAYDDIFNGDLSEADHVYVIQDGERFIAFLATNDLELTENEQSCLISLHVVHREERNRGIGKELHRAVFESREFKSVMGVSNTPSEVSACLQIAKEYGYTGYYGGYKNGEYGERGTEEEREKVGQISEEVRKIYADSGSTIPIEDMPEDTVVITDAGTIPPLQENAIHFRPEERGLDATFRQWLLPTQEKYLPYTTYGIFLNFKEE